ncbi:helix-turn-helix domain-containing protein [Microvirga mediterraneensis]|uniref:helix-turn-helix domain-containing protein n=1 Tax=Microvirga mediterraneensis TaxID=2754695 RepID=UPI001FE7122F|nr:helix-turn-helix domain-containing protein [Microvirga mediterraneensis]
MAKTRSNSKLPELVDLFLSRPPVTVPLGAKLLKVTPKAVDLMLQQLGGALPRELTGRTAIVPGALSKVSLAAT